MASDNAKLKRIEIFPYFEGVNSLVSSTLFKKGELYHVENARSTKIGYIEKRDGFRRLGNEIISLANYGIFFFENTTSTNTGFYRVSNISGTTSIYYLDSSSVWTALTGEGTGISAGTISITNADRNLFFVNGVDENKYIQSNGSTVVASGTSASSHTYGSPIAHIINYYKDRIYLGNYTVGSTNYKNGILFSSRPLGIISLVDGDHVAPVTSIKVTDTKYIRASDTLDIYRGGLSIGSVTVTAKTEDTLTVNSFGSDLDSADELWVSGTYSTGEKKFRWPDNPASGLDVKQYNTFKLTGSANDSLTMMENIGNVMIIANKTNMASWNDYNLQNFDIGIGCVSSRGYAKSMGVLWFIGYNGLYATTGGVPKLMSSKVQKYFDGATKSGIEASAVGIKGLSVFCAIGNVTLYNDDGSTKKTISNVVLEYEMRQENWYVHIGVDAKQFATYISSSDPDRLQFIASSGHVYEFLNGLDDDEAEIPFLVETPNLQMSKNFESIIYPKAIIVEVVAGSDIQFFISLDDEMPYEIEDSAKKGINILKINSRVEEEGAPRGNKIKIIMKEYSKRSCKVSRIALLYDDSIEEEEKRKHG